MTPMDENAATMDECLDAEAVEFEAVNTSRLYVINADFGDGSTSDIDAICEEASKINRKPFYYCNIKHLFDIAFSLIVIIIGFIPCAILSIFIAIETKVCPIYSQMRAGNHGEFKFYKFRSMAENYDDVEKYFMTEQLEQWNKEYKVDKDNCVTKLGAVLRKTSIDEQSQFINILAGKMSVIGARCITISELHWFEKDVALLLSRPAGITSAWQIGERNKATFQNGTRQAIELDYCRCASLSMNGGSFFATILTMFFHRAGK